MTRLVDASLRTAESCGNAPKDADAPGRVKECRHCGLPIPTGLLDGFCCSGCRAVHELLTYQGLDRFYSLGGGTPVGATPSPSRHDWLEDLLAQSPAHRGVVRLSVDLQGIRCAACVWVLQEVWRRRDGAIDLRINPTLGRADLVFDPDRLDVADYLIAVERLGYRVAPPSKSAPKEERSLLIRFGVCTALSMNAMMFAAAGYTGMTTDDPNHALFEALGLGIATIAFLIGAPVFLKAAIGGLKQRVLHMDLPIAIGLVLAYGGSVVLYLQGVHGSYFDTVTIFLTLMLLGRYLQQRAVRRNRDFLLRNDGAEHLRTQVLDGSTLRQVPVREVKPGDRLWITPGDLVPVCARLLGTSSASFSIDWINGESVPRSFGPADEIPAGAFLSGMRSVQVEAKDDAEGSGLLRLLANPDQQDRRLADGAPATDQSSKASFWQALNRWYVTGVLTLATLGAALWAWIDPTQILNVTVSLLVVTCPCALGIATPLAFDLSLSLLRRNGVFVRTMALLDKVRHLRRIFFDKTGTLTSGEAVATVLRPVPDSLTTIVRTMAASSRHPVSRAVRCAVDGAGPVRTDLVVTEQPGSGLEVIDGGRVYRLGAARFVLGAHEDPDGLCYFSCDGHVEGVFAIAEDLRAGAADEVAALRAKGLSIGILTGDRQERARKAARALGLSDEVVHAGLTPEQKAEHIRAADHGDTLMVGDGLNDGPAFAAAFCAGTPAIDRPVMPSKADFAFAGAGAGAVLSVLEMGHRFARVTRRNLRLSTVYNTVVVTLALSGAMTPLLCAILMPISSLTLIAHTSISMRRGLPRLEPA